MMSAFTLHTTATAPATSNPSSADLRTAFKTFEKAHIHAFIRQWLTEGVPAIFAPQPFLYEDLRNWMGMRFKVSQKCFSLLGSARFGYSLTKNDFGKPFNPSSDLDLACVDSGFFMICMTEAQRWGREFDAGKVVPTSDLQRKYWPENRRQLDQHIDRGFIQTDRIPAMDSYPKLQDVLNSMSLIPNKLKITPNAPKVSKASLRVYRDWDALTAQVTLNLRAALL